MTKLMVKLTILFLLFIAESNVHAKVNGEELFKKGNYKEAQEYYIAEGMKRGPEPEIQFGYGASAYKLNEIDDAVKAFEAVSRIDDPALSAKAFYNLGNAYYQKQDYEKSLSALKKSLELNPGDMDAKINFEMLKRQLQQNQNPNQDQNDQKESKDQNKQNNPEKDDQKHSSRDKSQKEGNQNQEDQDKQKGNPDDEKMKKEGEEKNTKPQTGKEENREKSPEKRNAEAILNSLKKDEKINQKRQIAHARTRTLEKDW